MQLAPTPQDEAERLEAVHQLNILDSDIEERFDCITRIVHHSFNIPTAYIALVDTNRVWFKSSFGKEANEANETPRDLSFCGHAICNVVTNDASSRLFEVPDANTDVRFSDNPLVTDKCRIRYYMAFVLQSVDHKNIGTLCMVDQRPRTLSDKEKSLFTELGFMAEEVVNNSQIFRQINSTGDNENFYADKLLTLSTKLGSVQKLFNDSLKKHNINFKEWCILNEIIHTELASPYLIGKKMGISPPLMTRKLDNLEIKNLVERWHSKDGDRRFVHLTCTEQGRNMWQQGITEANELGENHLGNIICLN